MQRLILVTIGILIALGCARVRVEAPKEPIKVDISMRLDIYQHIEKDIDQIEGIVSGAKDSRSWLWQGLASTAYAEEALDPEVEQAALRRKERLEEISSLEGKGIVGENKSGLVEIKKQENTDTLVKETVTAENNDRMLIYKYLSRKNHTSLEEIQKIYAKRLQADAPVGSPIESLNEATGAYEWKEK